MTLKQGQIVKWENSNKQQILWMVTEDLTKGIVIHSDNILTIGSITDLSDFQLTSFVGTINISSAAD